jgi:hypothetical protein
VHVANAMLRASGFGAAECQTIYISGECIIIEKVVTSEFLMLHDLVDVVPRRNGRRYRMRVQDFYIFVSPTGQMEGS